MEDTIGCQIKVNIGQATQSGKSTLTGNISMVYLAAETKLVVFIPYTANATSSSEGGQGNVTCTTAPCQEKMPSEYIACTSTDTNCNKDKPHFENLLYFICSSEVLHFLLQASLSHHMKCLRWRKRKKIKTMLFIMDRFSISMKGNHFS